MYGNMEQNTLYINDLIGKRVRVTTSGGAGTKDAIVGEYRGTMLGFDGEFVKLEYDIRKFAGGASVKSEGIIIINVKHIITAEEYTEQERF